MKKRNRKRAFLARNPRRRLQRAGRGSTRRKSPVTVISPQNFSLINNAKEVLGFFSKAKTYLDKKKNVILDFSQIDMITPDAIVLLLAKVTDRRYTNSMQVFGIRSRNPEIDKIFRSSGFYKIINLEKTSSDHGAIHTKQNTVVDTKIAAEVRKLTAKKTFGDDIMLHPLYRTLIECMANTKQHAKGKSDKDETWWLAVFHNEDTKITSFSFIDTGIGIFKSARIKSFTKFAVNLGIRSNIDVLKRLLAGKLLSSTGLKHRGKGIPKIYTDFKNYHIHNLHIIANDVFANLGNGTFIEMEEPLNGTFYYWEIIPDNMKN